MTNGLENIDVLRVGIIERQNRVGLEENLEKEME